MTTRSVVCICDFRDGQSNTELHIYFNLGRVHRIRHSSGVHFQLLDKLRYFYLVCNADSHYKIYYT